MKAAEGLGWGFVTGVLAGIATAVLITAVLSVGSAFADRSVETGLAIAVVYAFFGIPIGAIVGGVSGAVLGLLLGVTKADGHARWIATVLMAGMFAPSISGIQLNMEEGLDLTFALMGLLVVIGATGLGWVSGLGFERLMARS